MEQSNSNAQQETQSRRHAPQTPTQWFLCKNQERAESQFRVHFYLCGLLIPRSESLEDFLDYVRDRISKIGIPQIVQIYQKVDDRHVDVLVGMRYDFQAINYLTGSSKKVQASVM